MTSSIVSVEGRRLQEQFDRDLSGGDLAPLLDAFADRLAVAVATRDETQLSALGATASRLVRRAERDGRDVALAQVPALRQTMRIARSALAHIDHARDVVEIHPTATERVLDLLRRSDRPLRSAAIADALGIARAQASRSLRDLTSTGAIRRANPGVADGRAVAYEIVSE